MIALPVLRLTPTATLPTRGSVHAAGLDLTRALAHMRRRT